MLRIWIMMSLYAMYGVAYAETDMDIVCNRVGGRILLLFGALGALQSVHDIVMDIGEIRSLTDREEPKDYFRYLVPPILMNRFLPVKTGPLFSGAGFCTLLNSIVRLCLAKKGWNLVWSDQKKSEKSEHAAVSG